MEGSLPILQFLRSNLPSLTEHHARREIVSIRYVALQLITIHVNPTVLSRSLGQGKMRWQSRDGGRREGRLGQLTEWDKGLCRGRLDVVWVAGVLVNGADGVHTVCQVDEEVSALVVERLVEKEEVDEGDGVADDQLVAIISGFNVVVTSTFRVCAVGYVGWSGNSGRDDGCWARGVSWCCVVGIIVRLEADGVVDGARQAVACWTKDGVPWKRVSDGVD